jgi:hypothetical protein
VLTFLLCLRRRVSCLPPVIAREWRQRRRPPRRALISFLHLSQTDSANFEGCYGASGGLPPDATGAPTGAAHLTRKRQAPVLKSYSSGTSLVGKYL